MRPTPKQEREALRSELTNDVAAFLMQGGTITEHDYTDNKTYKDSLDRTKRIGSRGLPPGLSTTTNPAAAAARAQVGAGKDHKWRKVPFNFGAMA